MSSADLPFLSSVMTRLRMNTVQRLPRSAGEALRKARSAISSTGTPRLCAKVSMKAPQPLEHASLSVMPVMTPWLTKMAFMSWPPMSSTNEAAGWYFERGACVRHGLDRVVVGVERRRRQFFAVAGGADTEDVQRGAALARMLAGLDQGAPQDLER